MTNNLDINNIKQNTKDLTKFVILLNTCIGKTYLELKEFIFPKINGLYRDNLSVTENDKGCDGKKIEYELFKNNPNCCSNPDLLCGYDIKVTKFKFNNTKNGYFAKERLTITNINRDYIVKCDSLESSKYFHKLSKILLFVFEFNTDFENAIFLGVIMFNYENLSNSDKKIIIDDFEYIQHIVKNECITQKGQKYLHIHSHGSKNSTTKAIGFKNNFVTQIFGQLNTKYIYNNNVATLI